VKRRPTSRPGGQFQDAHNAGPTFGMDRAEDPDTNFK